jgi:hypothetical protein
MRVALKLVLAASAALAGVPAFAADVPAVVVHTAEQPARPGEARWSFATAAYLWAAGLSGDVASFGLPAVSIDASFSDIVDDLDFGAMFVNEVRYGRAGLFTDFIYVKISGSEGTPRGRLAESVGLDTESLIFTAAAEYRVVDRPDATLDLMAGARVWSVDTELSFNGGFLGGAGASDGDTWVDAMAGLKGRFDLTPQWYLSGWAMAGGGSSDFMWDLWGGVGYQITDRFSALAGYRGTGVDYSNDEGFVYDVVQHGPVLGAVIRF